MADLSDTIDLDLPPSDYATEAALAWVEKINRNPALTWSDLRTRVIAQWGNRVDNVERRIQAKLSGLVYNVRSYGAVGDGVADDSAAVQDTIDAAALAGGSVFLPAGTYALTTSLEYADGVLISGAGRGSTLLAFTGSGYAFGNPTPGSTVSDLAISDLSITYGAASSGGIHLQDTQHSTVRAVAVTGDTGGHGTAIRVSGASYAAALNNLLDECVLATGQYGVHVSSRSMMTGIHRCRISSMTTGVYHNDGLFTIIRGSAVESNTTGINIEASASGYNDGLVIDACHFESNTTHAATTGSAAYTRYLKATNNTLVGGTALSAALSGTTEPVILGNGGSAGGELYISSAASTGPVFALACTTAGSIPVRISQQETASGSPNILEVSGGRSASHALSIGTWSGGVHTETAYWTAAGSVTAVDGTFTGTLSAGTFNPTNITLTTAGALITLGNGTANPMPGLFFRRPAANSLVATYANSTGGNERWGFYFDTSHNLRYNARNGTGFTATVPALRLNWSSTDGRSSIAVNRVYGDVANSLSSGDFALSAGWGSTASVSVVSSSSDTRGRITITANGTGLAANPTCTLTFTDGSFGAVAFAIVGWSGGTGTGITGFTWSAPTTTLVITAAGTPAAGETYILTWMVMG